MHVRRGCWSRFWWPLVATSQWLFWRANFNGEVLGRNENSSTSEGCFCKSGRICKFDSTSIVIDTHVSVYHLTNKNKGLHLFGTVKKRMFLSFCGSGFLGIYHLGVAQAFVLHGRDLLVKITGFCGASSGSLVAALLAVKPHEQTNLEVCKEFCIDVAEKSRQKRFGVLSPDYSLLKDVELFLDAIIPEDAYEVASGKLHISLTRVADKKNYLVSNFNSNDHLRQCLLASCCIPHVTGKEVVFVENQKYMDGGFTDNLPTLSSDNISVSPFCGDQDISPRDASFHKVHLMYARQNFKMNYKNLNRGLHALFPPNQDRMQRYLDQGFQDGTRYLRQKGFYALS